MNNLLGCQDPFPGIQLCQLRQFFRRIGHVNGLIFRCCPVQQQRPHIAGEFDQNLADVLALHQQPVKNRQGRSNLTLPHRTNQLPQNFPANDTADGTDRFRRNRFRHDAALLQQAQRVAHAAFRSRRNQLQRFLFRFNVAAFRHFLQMSHDFFLGDRMEIKSLAAGMNGRQNLLGLRRRQNKYHMFGRFFQGFQQRVAGLRGQHVGFVDDIHFIPAIDRCKVCVLVQIFNIVHATVGSGIQLLYVQCAAISNLPTVQAFAAGMVGRSVLAVQRFRENTRRSSFSRTAGSGKQISMRNTAAGQCIHQRLFDRSLSHQRIKAGRTPAQI